jgi:hypothetical protein
MKAFINPHDPDNTALKKTLTDWLKTKLALNDDTEVSVQEHLCSEPSCVHAETVFKVENGQNTDGPLFLQNHKAHCLYPQMGFGCAQKNKYTHDTYTLIHTD